VAQFGRVLAQARAEKPGSAYAGGKVGLILVLTTVLAILSIGWSKLTVRLILWCSLVCVGCCVRGPIYQSAWLARARVSGPQPSHQITTT